MGILPTLAILVLIIAVVAGVLVLRRRRARGTARDDAADRLDTVVAWPPSATRVLGQSEIRAYEVLAQALPGCMVLAKVPLARFVKVPRRHSYSEWLRRLGYQCADLVVCDAASTVLAVVNVRPAAIEAGARAVKRQRRMARVLEAAGIALLDWKDDALPGVAQARELVLSRAPAASAPVPDSRVDRGRPEAVPAPHDAPREPPPSTWFDEFNSGPAPLGSAATHGAPAPSPAPRETAVN